MADDPLLGILVVDKPAGPTSHDVVAAVRRAGGLRRVGHTGTLDPFATGVLVLCLGRATRLASHLTVADKRYRAVLRLGQATDTQDLTGAVTSEADCGDVTPDALRSALDAFRGPIAQVPPMYSAKRKGGKRLHELAREGVEVEREPVPVTIHALELLGTDWSGDWPEATLDVTCSKGTYIRTLAADIGAALGVGGHLRALRRLASGVFTEADSHPLDALTDRAAVAAALRSPLDGLADRPRVVLEGEEARRFTLGQRLGPAGRATDLAPPIAVVDDAGTLLGLGKPTPDGALAPALVLATPSHAR